MILATKPGIFLTTLCALTFALAGCGEKNAGGSGPTQVVAPAPESGSSASATTQTQVTPEARAEAEKLFSTRCTPCHGMTGGGDGVASKGLNPPPRNFHLKEWQAKVTDDHIEKIIQYGGASVGLSPAMPANPDLMSKPAVVAALREHVRSLAQ